MRFQVKIRFQGHVSWVEVDANDQAQAKALVRQQYGPRWMSSTASRRRRRRTEGNDTTKPPS